MSWSPPELLPLHCSKELCAYVCMYVCICVSVCDKGSEQRLWSQAVSDLLPNITSRSLLSFAWGLGEETFLPPSPLLTHFHSEHEYLLTMPMTFILPKSLLCSDQNYCNRLLPRCLMSVPVSLLTTIHPLY